MKTIPQLRPGDEIDTPDGWARYIGKRQLLRRSGTGRAIRETWLLVELIENGQRRWLSPQLLYEHWRATA